MIRVSMSSFPNQKVTVSEEVLFQEVDGEAVLLDLTSEKYFGLNPVGTRIWQLLREHGDLDKMKKIMLLEFEVGEDQLQTDIFELIADLEKAGLIKRVESDE